MKKLYFFLLFVVTNSFGQLDDSFDKKKVDSLFVILKNTPSDTSRVKVYQDILNENFLRIKFSKREVKEYDSINNKMFALSKKLNYKVGIGYYYANCYKMHSGLANILKAQQLFLQENRKLLYYETFVFLNEYCIHYNKYDEVKKNVLKCLQSKDLSNSLRMTFCEQMSRSYYQENSLYKALFYLKKGLSYNKKKDNKIILVRMYDALANINLKFSRTSQAHYYINLYYQLVKENDYERHYYYRIKSRIFQKEKRYDEALKLCLKNDIYFKTLDFYKGDSGYMSNKKQIATNYYYLKNYSMAIMEMEDYLKNDNLISYKRLVGSSFLSLLYNDVGEYDKAIFYINIALKGIKEIADPIEKAEIFKNKSIIAKSFQDYPTALEYSNKSAVLIQEYYQKREQEDAFNTLNNMEDNEKESRIKRLKIAALEKTVQIDRQKNFLILILLGLAVAITSIMVYRKLYGSIKKRNNIIEVRNYELLSSQNIIQKALQEKEVLVKEIHHRVKNNLQLVMSLLNMQLRHNKEVDIASFVKTSQSRISSIALLYEQLYQQKSEGAVNFKEYVVTLANSIISTYSDLQDQVSLDIEIPTIYFDLETATPLGLIISEFINNSFKHAFPSGQKGIISLKLTTLKGNKHELSISDNGVGLAQGYLDKNTLGIQLVNSLVAQIKGVIVIRNNGGASYSIQF